MSFEMWLKQSKPVIPVIVIDEIEQAVPLARALLAGGVTLLEVTLRTPVAFAAIERIAKEVPEAIVGVGTATKAEHIQQAKDAGAQFALSPGISEGLVQKSQDLALPFMPGVMTPSDIIHGLDCGLTEFKFFPAQQAGGVKMLKAFSGPFPNVKFCPTGGISQESAQDFLSLDNVMAVGGSWLCSKALMAEKDWAGIEELAKSS
ncbi:bifunctional 4-hydroxy-2-oxoglutarate aldolase/2-dehydro-3-deoxy-phosphogluconate aldolase [Oceaniserpentilla sp. 4NH20-0058]|uniref:bifunctional 4-hydroxy-2-oxoglutarate aldolase/2-dehydro-3-deoxy-phosphogluconate aldolase n=1 Tax=Oceaniserpentilla sp. 4NH20-0058 TaxID=3127660 RepID=UPI003107E158